MMRKNHKKNINGKDSERFGKIRIITFKSLYLRFLCLFLFLLNFTFISCEEAGISPDDYSEVSHEFQLDEKICTDFAIKMHTSLAKGDTSFINSYLDWKGIEQSLSADSTYWTSEKIEIFNSWKANISLGEDFIGEFISGNHLRFITYYQLDGKHFIILRNYIEPQTVNYFEFELRSNEGTISIVDVYDFSQSKLLSTMAKEYCNYYGKFHETWKTVKAETELTLTNIEEKIANGNLKAAYAQLIEMDGSFKSTYMYTNIEESILLQSNVESIILDYLYDKSQRIALNEKGRSLTMFYLNAYAGNNQDAMIALANLEDAVGEDGVLDYLKGNLFFEEGEMQKALEAFNRALAYDNEIFSFHVAKVKTLIEKKAYVEAAESLLVMDDSFNVKDLDWDEEFKLYPDFLSSEAYATWKNRLSN